MIQDDTTQKHKLGQRPAVFTGGPFNFEAAAMPTIDELGVLQSARESAPAAAVLADDKATVALVSPERTVVTPPPVTWSWGCTLEPSAAMIAYYASLPSHMPGRRLQVITLD